MQEELASIAMKACSEHPRHRPDDQKRRTKLTSKVKHTHNTHTHTHAHIHHLCARTFIHRQR
eukprot:695534-Pelagomonas_calceolata.AAC.1